LLICHAADAAAIFAAAMPMLARRPLLLIFAGLRLRYAMPPFRRRPMSFLRYDIADFRRLVIFRTFFPHVAAADIISAADMPRRRHHYALRLRRYADATLVDAAADFSLSILPLPPARRRFDDFFRPLMPARLLMLLFHGARARSADAAAAAFDD
jgi:hypothetical protein